MVARLVLKRTSLDYKMQKLGISRPPQWMDVWQARQGSVSWSPVPNTRNGELLTQQGRVSTLRAVI
jgi:hypothetical protein